MKTKCVLIKLKSGVKKSTAKVDTKHVPAEIAEELYPLLEKELDRFRKIYRAEKKWRREIERGLTALRQKEQLVSVSTRFDVMIEDE